MSIRERFEWLVRLGLLIFVLAAAAFLSAITAMRFAIQGREVELPNLVGKTSAQAQGLLQSRGLQLKIVDRIYSDLPANVVVRQNPAAGEQMKISQDVRVMLSLGPQRVTVPALSAQSLRIARIQLLQAGLQVGEVTTYTSPDLPADTVLQQNPVAGTRATTPQVNLLVSQTQPASSYVMPWMVGMNLADADRLASSGDLKFKVTTLPQPQWPKGTITAQSPDAGSKVDSTTPIQLTVAQ